MARLSVASENTAITSIIGAGSYYLSLHSADPGQTGASELTGGSYARQAISFSAASGGQQASSNSQTFTSLPAASGGIPYFGLWSASSGGTYIGGGTTSGLTGSLPAGISVNFATSSVTVSIS
jgi:hypothetical protein